MLGRGADLECLREYEVGELFEQLKTVNRGRIEFFINREYVLPFIKNDGFPCFPHEEYLTCYKNGSDTIYVTDNLIMNAEFTCSAYSPTITVTPDGYVTGCTAGLASTNYHICSAGNIRNNDLEALIKLGREGILSWDSCYYSEIPRNGLGALTGFE